MGESGTITLIIRARNLAKEVFRDAANDAKGFGGQLGALRGLASLNVWLEMAHLIEHVIRRINEWKKEHMAAMAESAKAEIEFRNKVREASQVDEKTISETRSTFDKGEGARGRMEGGGDEQARLHAQEEAIAAQEKKINLLKEEAEATIKVQAEQDTLAKKYEGMAGTATLAIEKANATLDKMSGGSGGAAFHKLDPAAQKMLTDDANAALVRAKTDQAEAIKSFNATQKQRNETVEKLAINEQKQITEGKNLTNLHALHEEQNRAVDIKNEGKGAAAEAQGQLDQARGFAAKAGIFDKQLRGGKLTDEEEIAIGSEKGLRIQKQRLKQIKIDEKQVDELRKRQAAHVGMTPRERQILARANEKANAQLAMDAARAAQAKADGILGELGKNTVKMVTDLDQIRKDLAANLQAK